MIYSKRGVVGMKFDEFTVGEVFKTKSYEATKEGMMEFAKQYDPQYMHLDEEKAKQSRFNGIIASGMYTLSVSFKLCVELGIYGDDIIAGRGMDNITFVKPVYPNDVLHTLVEVIRKRKTSKGNGLVTLALTTYNHRDEKVLKGNITAMLKV